MRPRSLKSIAYLPTVTYFKPCGVPLRLLESVKLTIEECEALRLKNLLLHDQQECAKAMGTSQSTVQRLLTSAYQKITDALLNGKAICIVNEQKPKHQE